MRRRGRRCLMRAAGAALVHTHASYPVTMALLAALRPARPAPGAGRGRLPSVALVIAAHDEEGVIARRVRDALALDYPGDRLEVLVASDGSTDGTVRCAREAGGDRVRVLDLPRGGKVAAQNAAVAASRSDVVAFSDANAFWDPGALRALVSALEDPGVGYACGELVLEEPDGTNQEGAYWRYELWVRERESRAWSVTAGNGAIYAVRREAYVPLDPRMGHDLALPTAIVRGGRRAVFTRAARARERMVPEVEGEFARKRRMMSRAWLILLRGRLWDPRGVPPVFAYALWSHRVLRYTSPFWHLAWVASALPGLRRGSRGSAAVVAAHAALGLAALAGGPGSARPLRLARYYAMVTAAPALGLLDAVRAGVGATWESPEGTR